MFATNWPLRGPARNSLQGGQAYDIGQFRNSISLPATESFHYTPLTRPSRQDTDISHRTLVPKQDSKVRTLLWPAVAITIPIALLSATLLGLVFGYRVRSEPSIFRNEAEDESNKHTSHVLVEFSASKLTVIVSRSTLTSQHDLCSQQAFSPQSHRYWHRSS